MAQILLNDIDDAVETIHWAAENGLRGGVLLPGVPPDSHLPPLYANDVYEPIWNAFEETGLPVNHHSGSAAPDYGRYPAGGVMWILETGFYAHRAFWALIFGGVFERHPKLKFVLAEAGMGWIAEEMPRTDFMAKRIFGGKVGELGFTEDQRLPKLPSEYFQQNIWVTASFMSPGECKRRNAVGVDKIMWASDYPHDEGTYPYSKESLRNTFHDVPEPEVRKMLSENAAQIYGFDLAALQPIADRVGMSPEEMATPPEALPTDTESNAFAGR
jgi:predicted TIM-barrel fold metal-dependent hydrolase